MSDHTGHVRIEVTEGPWDGLAVMHRSGPECRPVSNEIMPAIAIR